MSMMHKRANFVIILVAALAAWWVGDRYVTPWFQNVCGYDKISDHDLSVILGHWIFGQLPRLLLCLGVWVVGYRMGLMPSIGSALSKGSSWRRVVVSGLIGGAVMLALTVVIGAAAGGSFGFYPYFPKMAGDLLSNLYEELVYRGVIFCAFYGAVAASAFPLDGRLNRVALVLATAGSSFVFGFAHDQYPMTLRIVIGTLSVGFVYPLVYARSLWAPWITHMIVDVVGDTILKL